MAARVYQVDRVDWRLLPLAEENHVPYWRGYAEEARQNGTFAVLSQRLPQFWFPVRSGMAASADYRAALYRGADRTGLREACGVSLQNPAALRLFIHDSLAGAVPVLLPQGREDFLNLFRALSCRHEPKPVPDSVGAAMIIGFNNWDRIKAHRRGWEASAAPGAEWTDEFRRFTAHKENYQGRLLLISDGPYSAVTAEAMGLPAEEWRSLSVRLRLEHECAHMLTYRLLQPTSKSVLDEFIADFLAILGVTGRFQPEWLLRFWGIGPGSGDYAGSRLAYYAPKTESEKRPLLAAWITALAQAVQTMSARHGADEYGQIALVNELLACNQEE